MPALNYHYAVGVGFRRGCSTPELIELIDHALVLAQLVPADICWLSSLQEKTEQPAFLELLDHYGWRASAVAAWQLEQEPHTLASGSQSHGSLPSAARIHKGVPGVAEPAALATLYQQGLEQRELLLPKQCSTTASVAIARASARNPMSSILIFQEPT